MSHDESMGKVFGTGTIKIAKRGKKGSILLVALSRPKVKNAFSEDMYKDLISMFDTASKDESISAVILTGSGPYFTSGADLKYVMSTISRKNEKKQAINGSTGKFMLAMMRFPKLIVAAVNGPAVGIGVTLLLHCDLCFCTKESTFWTPFARIAFGMFFMRVFVCACVCAYVCVCVRVRVCGLLSLLQ